VAGADPAEVVVRPGDSLWRIAEQHLPAEAPPTAVAAAWPQWWSANRAVVGDDPDLLVPGQVLQVPR
jgi:nucleoid-associated protein YgaU